MSHPISLHHELRKAYVHEALGLDAAAQKLNLAYTTAKKWKLKAAANGDDWDKARAASHLAGQGSEAIAHAMFSTFVTLYNTIVNQLNADVEMDGARKAEALSRLGDAYHKTMAGTMRGAPKLAKLSIALDVMEQFANYAVATKPEHAELLIELLSGFEPMLRERYA